MKVSWDIFCKVVDNYGDAGVCWRLARQLVAEHGCRVRLWVDDLAALARLAPSLRLDREQQALCGVELRRWPEAWTGDLPGEVVIEAFGCALPEALIERMATAAPPPVWINLEYLSAESWVERSHGLPSRHPRLPLQKYFFFPGFTPATGGLLRERGLIAARAAFQSSPEAAAGFLRSLGAPPAPQGRKVSLFCYPQAPVAELIEVWEKGTEAVFCLVPEGAVARACATALGLSALPAGALHARGALSVFVYRFLPQEDYDRLLWACELNFVRGEDSFVRAQWAARPMVWQPYPQDAGAHLAKLEAFLDRQAPVLAQGAAAALGALSRAWSGQGRLSEAWARFAAHTGELELGARRWAERLAQQPDLCRQLVDFAEKPDIMRGSSSH